MKQYYFLDNQKQWNGPYNYLQILFLCIRGTISVDSFVWYQKARENANNPYESIYPRHYAYRVFPKWIFKGYLKVLLHYFLKVIKSKLSSNRNINKLLNTPIPIKHKQEKLKNTYLVPSVVAIHDFIAPGKFRVKLVYAEYKDDIGQAKVEEYPINLFSDNEPGIRFEITMNNPPSVHGVYNEESYGLQRELWLKDGNNTIHIQKNSVFDFSAKISYKPQILKGRFKQANIYTGADSTKLYNRLIIPIVDDKPINPQAILMATGCNVYDNDCFNIQETPMGVPVNAGGSYTTLVIDKFHYDVYNLTDRLSKGSLLVIDGKGKEELDIFRSKAEIIRIAFAIMSGKFYSDSCYYVSSKEPSFRNINSVWFEMERKSVLTNRRTINFDLYKPVEETKVKSINRISTEQFSKLCQKLYEDKDLLRVAEIVISAAGNNDPIQQGALYSVALETITSILGNKSAKDLKPITDKKISNRFIAELKDLLEKYKPEIGESAFTILNKRINDINGPTNQDKLVKTFAAFKIELSDSDIATIGKRNDYLHGRNPLKTTEVFELTQITLRLHTLIVALLLKYTGYSGHIINLDYNAYFIDEDKQGEITSKIIQNMNRLLEELEKATEQKETTRINELLQEIKEIAPNNQIFRLI